MTDAPEAAHWRACFRHNRGAAAFWIVDRGEEKLVNAAGRQKRFRSEAAALAAVATLNGKPTHWLDPDRGLTVTEEFLNSARSSSDWRDVYYVPCVILNGRPYATGGAA